MPCARDYNNTAAYRHGLDIYREFEGEYYVFRSPRMAWGLGCGEIELRSVPRKIETRLQGKSEAPLSIAWAVS